MNIKRETLSEFDEDILFLSEEMFDDALAGVVRQFGRPTIACYHYKKIIEILQAEGMSYDEAVEYFEFNMIGAYVGDSTPCFIENIGDLK